jgi:hypothetical protein
MCQKNTTTTREHARHRVHLCCSLAVVWLAASLYTFA